MGRWLENDETAGLMHDVQKAIYQKLKKGFQLTRHVDRAYTPGAVNVCLILESGILDIFDTLDEKWFSFLNAVKKDMENLSIEAKNSKMWEDQANRRYCLRSYLRMTNKLNSILERQEK